MKQGVKMNKLFIGMTIALLLGVFMAAAQEYDCSMGGGMMYGLYGGYGSGMMLLSGITWFLVIALVIAAIYWLVKSANKKK